MSIPMTTQPYYSTGTVAIPAGSFTMTGTGTNWLDSRVRQNAIVTLTDAQFVDLIASVDSATQCTLYSKNNGSAITGASYTILSLPDDIDTMLDVQAIKALLDQSPRVIYRAALPTAADGLDGDAAIYGTTTLGIATRASGTWTAQTFGVASSGITDATTVGKDVLTAANAAAARTATGAQAALGFTPVNIAGDTMTGPLTVPNHLHVEGTSSAYLDLKHTGASAGLKNVRMGTSNGDITFESVDDAYSSATEHARLTAAGNLGIGTSSPLTILHVIGTIRTTGSSGTYLDFNHSGGAAGLKFMRQGFSSGVMTWDQVDDTYTTATERMRLDTAGRLLLNNTATLFSARSHLAGAGSSGSAITTTASSSFALIVGNMSTSGDGGFVYFGTEAGAATQRGSIQYNRTANTTGFNTTSDRDLKKNIRDAGPIGGWLMSVRVREHDWRNSDAHTHYGLIAQELHKIAPEAVSKGHGRGKKRIPWMVDKSALVPRMLKTMQEQREEIDAMQARIAALEAKLS